MSLAQSSIPYKPFRDVCPVCKKLHDVITNFTPVKVMLCPLMPNEVIYCKGSYAESKAREFIKESLFGTM